MNTKNYEVLLPYCITPQEHETIKSCIEHGSVRKAAKALNQNVRTIERKCERVEKRMVKHGFVPEHGLNTPAPPGFPATGYSRYFKTDDGGYWLKTTADKGRLEEIMQEAIDAFSESLPKARPVKSSKSRNADLLNCYLITDYHLGALSWDEETGENWDTEIAEQLIIDWFAEAIKRAPDTHTAVFAQLGDFLHWDGLEAITPASRHLLDADTRFQKVVRVAIKVIRCIIKLLLTKHQKVHVVMADANHDPASSVWLREWLAAHYEDEPRITVDQNSDTYYCYEFGQTSLFFHHGHKRKPENIDDVFVAKYRDVFGRTKYSYAHLGHLHHVKELETNLMLVRQHRTLAAKDAYASRGGWMSGRDARVIMYHKEYGYAGEIAITPEMLK